MMKKWSTEENQVLNEFYPHFGAKYVADKIGVSYRQVKGRVDYLGLKILPKQQRKCMGCETGKQLARYTGYYCLDCHNKKKAASRRVFIADDPLKERLKETLRTILYRSKTIGIECDITLDFLLEMWKQQQGLCYYTGRPMIATNMVGRGRDMDALSVDKIDPKLGYTSSNIVLCSWWANAAKSTLTKEELIARCSEIIRYLRTDV